MSIDCIKCGRHIEEREDTTVSSGSERSSKGQHTGDIYFCDECDTHIIDDLLNATIREWSY